MKIKSSRKINMPVEYHKTLSIHLNDEDNGGESVNLKVDVYKDTFDTNLYTSTSFILSCYGTHNSRFELWGVDYKVLKEALSLIEQEIENGSAKVK